jgi:hypothetical protein
MDVRALSDALVCIRSDEQHTPAASRNGASALSRTAVDCRGGRQPRRWGGGRPLYVEAGLGVGVAHTVDPTSRLARIAVRQERLRNARAALAVVKHQATGRSKVMIRPSTAPGPTRPLTSA